MTILPLQLENVGYAAAGEKLVEGVTIELAAGRAPSSSAPTARARACCSGSAMA